MAMSSQAPATTKASPAETLRRFPWGPLLWFGVLLGAVYGPVLARMVLEWFKVEEMGHGIFVPLVAGYVIWKDRDRILGQPIEPSWWGAALVIWGGIQLVLGTVGADFFLARTAFLFTMVGMLWMAAGWKIVRALAFPLLLLLFMIRMPLFIYSQITLPLQLFASQAAASALTLLGIPVVREGNVLELASQRLSVVEACSGIRSLLSLSFLSLIYAYFFDHKVWMRFVLLAASIPIAILANASRITLTGLVSEYKKEFAEGTYHTFEGWVIFMVALIILIITHQVINRIHSLIHGQK